MPHVLFALPKVKMIEYDITLAKKQSDGMALGYPIHLCHLMEYHYAIAIPDTPTGRAYHEWTIGRKSKCKFMLLNLVTFANHWGPAKAADIDFQINSTGAPPALWYIFGNIPGYSATDDSWSFDNLEVP